MPELRPIERGIFVDVERPASFGPASQLQWIAIDQLVVDDSYQRPIESQTSRGNVRAIAAGFDWRRFAPVIVSPIAGGRFAIVDGQHRTTAALLVGIEQVPGCVILADEAEQARAFAAINGQVTAIKPAQIFKAKLAHGDPVAKRVEAVCAAAGVKLLYSNRSASQMEPGESTALLAIMRAVEQHGDKTARIALEVIRRNAKGAGGYLRPAIISAMVDVLDDHRAWRDDARLQAAIDSTDLDRAYRSALKDAAGRHGVNPKDLLQAALITHLDRKLTKAA